MIFREFRRADNVIIGLWFGDGAMRRWLESPWTEAELEAMEGEENGKVFVVEDGGKVVALIGCYLPDDDLTAYVVSVVAVDPDERGKGYGKWAVGALLGQYGADKEWVAYCDVGNVAAHRFLEGLGWELAGQKAEMEGMITFRVGV